MKHSFLFTVALFVAALANLNCGSSPQSLEVTKRSRTFDRDYQTVLKAVVDYCTENGFPIQNVDKEFGLINTDYKANENLGLPIVLESRSKINFALKSISATQTRVVANVSIQKHGGTTWTGSTTDWNEVTISESQAIDVYKRVLDGIQKQFPK